MISFVKVEQLFAGGLRQLEPEGQSTGIYKKTVPGEAVITRNGIAGDEQADTRVHGGPEKAVHHYAAENYKHLAKEFPHRVHELIAGSMGENISTHGLNEHNVHIGDIFLAGTSLLQVSQPRSPCWKINHRFDEEKMSMFVVRQHLTGWYYRVLRPGTIQVDDHIVLMERHTERFSIEAFWRIQLLHRPDIDDLLSLSKTPGLAEDWRSRLSGRARWLRAK